MAISLRAAGSWAAANATTQTVTLPTHADTDMLILRVGFKHATMPTTVTVGTAGWTKLGETNGTGGASSNGGGGVQVAVFWKEARSNAETNPVVTFNGGATAATPSAAVAMAYQKAATEVWLPPEGAGTPIAAATSISDTIDSHVSATAGDLIDEFHVTNDNTTLTVPTFTQASLTLDAVTESPATALSSATSNDISADGCYRTATAGTSSAAAVITGTNSVADVGAGWTTRLRVATSDCYSDVVVADGPGLYARFGESSGSTAVEEIAGNDGTYIGSPTLGVTGALSGDSNTAFTTTTGKYATFPDHAGADLGDVFSIEVWLKRGTISTFQNVLNKHSGAYTIYVDGSNTIILGKSGTGDVLTSSVAFTDTSSWHHLVVTKNGAAGKMYLDAVDISGSFGNETMTDNTSILEVGWDGGSAGEEWAGSIDELALYPAIVLTAAQVFEHYSARSITCTSPDVDANAGVASATGAASNASVSVQTNGGLAAATGAAHNPAPSVRPSGGVASATGTAYNPGFSASTTAGVAAATGAANNAAPSVGVNAGHAAATGTAYGAQTAVGQSAGVAAATITAPTPSVHVQVNAGVASATMAALDATVSTAVNVNVDAGHAAATGTANNPSASVQTNGAIGAATGTAHAPSVHVQVNAGVASATGEAFGATVSTASQVNVNAGNAAAAGTAYNPSASVQTNGAAVAALAAAYNPSLNISVASGVATATMQAFNASVSVQPNAGVATATATAYGPSVAVAVLAGIAAASGVAYGADVSNGAVEGGTPPSGSATHFVPRGSAHNAKPTGSATHPTPRGS